MRNQPATTNPNDPQNKRQNDELFFAVVAETISGEIFKHELVKAGWKEELRDAVLLELSKEKKSKEQEALISSTYQKTPPPPREEVVEKPKNLYEVALSNISLALSTEKKAVLEEVDNRFASGSTMHTAMTDLVNATYSLPQLLRARAGISTPNQNQPTVPPIDNRILDSTHPVMHERLHEEWRNMHTVAPDQFENEAARFARTQRYGEEMQNNPEFRDNQQAEAANDFYTDVIAPQNALTNAMAGNIPAMQEHAATAAAASPDNKAASEAAIANGTQYDAHGAAPEAPEAPGVDNAPVPRPPSPNS